MLINQFSKIYRLYRIILSINTFAEAEFTDCGLKIYSQAKEMQEYF